MMGLMIKTAIIKTLMKTLGNDIKIITAPWYKYSKVFFRNIFGLGSIRPHTYSQFTTAELPSQEKGRGEAKLSLDHNKPKWGARHTFDVGFKRGIFSVDVFPAAGCLINFQHSVRIRYFDRTQYFGTVIHTDSWFWSLSCTLPRGFCFKMRHGTFPAAPGKPRCDILNNASWEFPPRIGCKWNDK